MKIPNNMVEIPNIKRMIGIASWAANLKREITEPSNISPMNLPAMNHLPTPLCSVEVPKPMKMQVHTFPKDIPIIAATIISKSIFFPSFYSSSGIHADFSFGFFDF